MRRFAAVFQVDSDVKQNIFSMLAMRRLKKFSQMPADVFLLTSRDNKLASLFSKIAGDVNAVIVDDELDELAHNASLERFNTKFIYASLLCFKLKQLREYSAIVNLDNDILMNSSFDFNSIQFSGCQKIAAVDETLWPEEPSSMLNKLRQSAGKPTSSKKFNAGMFIINNDGKTFDLDAAYERMKSYVQCNKLPQHDQTALNIEFTEDDVLWLPSRMNVHPAHLHDEISRSQAVFCHYYGSHAKSLDASSTNSLPVEVFKDAELFSFLMKHRLADKVLCSKV